MGPGQSDDETPSAHGAQAGRRGSLRGIVAVLAVVVVALVGLSAGCGAVSQAEQKLNAAIDRYNAAVDNVMKLDLKTAAEAQITAVRTQLAAAFKALEKQAKKVGRDTADLLRTANTKLDKTLHDAAGLPASARDQVAAALKSAADSLSSDVQSVWKDIKSVVP
jgi:hypothetical protein